MRTLVLALLIASSAFADAMYTVSASSTFAMGEGTAMVGSLLIDLNGAGAAASSGAYAVSAGGPLPPAKSRVIGMSGSAFLPGGFAESTVMTGHIMTIDNSLGLVPKMVAFTFSYAWAVLLGHMPPNQFATGGAFFHITGIDTETLLIGGIPVAEFLVHPTYSTAFGGTGGFGGGMVDGAIVVPAGGVATFSVITDGHGFALVAPEPAALAGPALGVLLFLARRRTRARG